MADRSDPVAPAEGFAARLSAAMLAAGGADGMMSDVHLAAELEKIGAGVTSSYVYMLRTGRRSNAGPELLMALAQVLHVPVAALAFGPADARDADRWNDAVALCADPDSHAITKALAGLSPGSRRAISALVTRFREIEGLEPMDR